MYESSNKGVFYIIIEIGAVNCQTIHQSRSRMVSTVQITYMCSKVCSERDQDFERPGIYPDHSTVKAGGDTFKPGRVTGALVQGPKLTLAPDNTKNIHKPRESGPPRYRQSAVRS